MKLIQAHVANFRCIIDSNIVEIGATTCLVGKNEAGKTAFLKALEGLRSVDKEYKHYNKTEDYPRRHLAEYDQRHGGNDARVIETFWELDDSDKKCLEDEFGVEAIHSREVRITKHYGTGQTTWSVPLNYEIVLDNLISRFGLSEEEAAPINGIKRTEIAAQRLGEIAEPTGAQSSMLAAINKFRDASATLKAIDLLNERTPRFLYFSHYDRMSGEISINQLNKDKSESHIREGDQVFLNFLEYAGTTLEELTAARRFEEMNAKCEAAANRITDQIFEYWTQNDQLSIEVRLDEGKPEDNPPFDAGPVARARVKNNLHRVTVPFSERSAGFIWFFSFLVKFAQIKKHEGNVIILLDEPGVTTRAILS